MDGKSAFLNGVI
jgi:hypothetical protein